jgi:hypothetical protein
VSYVSSDVVDAHNTDDTVLEEVDFDQDKVGLHSEDTDLAPSVLVELGIESKLSTVVELGTNSEMASIIDTVQNEALEHADSDELTVDENFQRNEIVPEPDKSAPHMIDVTIPEDSSVSEDVITGSEKSFDQDLLKPNNDEALQDEIGSNEEVFAEVQQNVAKNTQESDDSRQTTFEVTSIDHQFIGGDSKDDVVDDKRGIDEHPSCLRQCDCRR